jgi:Mlc titration factor MtfA (ptsG expression regulator)
MLIAHAFCSLADPIVLDAKSSAPSHNDVMSFPWPFHDRHKEIVNQPFPDEWLMLLKTRVRHFVLLKPGEQVRLLGDLRIFMSEKNWEGALGFDVTDDVKVTISALASLLTVGFEKHDYFPNVPTIIVYPTSYVAPSVSFYGQSIETTTEARLGEAHGSGPIILSWHDIAIDFETKHGHGLVVHEFAHKLDFRDGEANGVPLLRDSAEYDEWAKIMSAEYENLVDDVRHSRHTPLRSYGATNPAEFFAVSTECFFEKSIELSKQKAGLYGVLRNYYGIDWAERFASAPTTA